VIINFNEVLGSDGKQFNITDKIND